jgi:hypothetical protein
MKKFISILLFFFVTSELFAQGWLTEENNISTNWNITFQFGSNLLLGELKKDLSGMNDNMNSTPSWGMNIQLSKMVWERIDLGLELGTMNYSGINKNPSTINYLMYSNNLNSGDNRFLPYPVTYKSNLCNFAVFSKYNFINFSSYITSFIKLNIFLRLGLGITYLSTELNYKEDVNYLLSGLRNPLFSTSLDLNFFKRFQGYIFPSLGANYQISDRIFFSAEMCSQFINTGLIDGVYNVTNQFLSDKNNADIDPYKIPVFDITGKLMIGCTYFFNFDVHRRTRWKAYPWYNNRYRSYFSKYQNPSSKKRIKERLPFYNNNFDE